MQNSEKIEKEVVLIISKRLGIPESTINKDSFLFDDLNASKLEIADIIQTLEENYQFRLDIKDIQAIDTVGHLIEIIIDNSVLK